MQIALSSSPLTDISASIIDEILKIPNLNGKAPIAPSIVDNISLILNCDTDSDLARALGRTKTTIYGWRKDMRVPLVNCIPFLALMGYETLAYGPIEGTIHAGRGFTRDPARACSNPSENGPVYIGLKPDFETIVRRLAFILDTHPSPASKHAAKALRTERYNRRLTRQKTRQWLLRESIPDPICHGLVKQYRVSLAWLLTGHGNPSADATQQS